MAQWLVTTGDTRLHRSQQDGLGIGEWVTSDCISDEHFAAALAVGDRVALRRDGRGGGIVAHGHVEAVISEHAVPASHPDRCSQHRVKIVFDELFLGRPMEREWFRAMTAPASYTFNSSRRGSRRPLQIPDQAWRAIVRLAHEERENWWPARWDIPQGAVVSRTDLYMAFGGQKNTKISDSEITPNTLLFKNSQDPDEPESDWSDDGAFLFTGMTERDKHFSHANEAVAMHFRRAKPLRVFRSVRGRCTYLGEFVLDEENPLQEWVATGRERIVHNRLIRDNRTRSYELMVPIFRMFPRDAISTSRPDLRRRPQRLRVSVELVHQPTSHSSGSVRLPSAQARHGESQTEATRLEAVIENLLELLSADASRGRRGGGLQRRILAI